MPSHYLNQRWHIVNWNLGIKISLKFQIINTTFLSSCSNLSQRDWKNVIAWWRHQMETFFWLLARYWAWWFETSSRSLWRHCNGERRCAVFRWNDLLDGWFSVLKTIVSSAFVNFTMRSSDSVISTRLRCPCLNLNLKYAFPALRY